MPTNVKTILDDYPDVFPSALPHGLPPDRDIHHVIPTEAGAHAKETIFLGHLVGQDGIKPDPAKVKAVKDWPVLTNVKEVRSFLGLTNYFRKFI